MTDIFPLLKCNNKIFFVNHVIMDIILLLSVCLSVMTKPRTIDLRLSAWTPTTQECYNSLMEFCADGLISDLLKLTHSGRTSRPECSAIMQGRHPIALLCIPQLSSRLCVAVTVCMCKQLRREQSSATSTGATLEGSWLLTLPSSLLSRKLAAAFSYKGHTNKH